MNAENSQISPKLMLTLYTLDIKYFNPHHCSRLNNLSINGTFTEVQFTWYEHFCQGSIYTVNGTDICIFEMLESEKCRNLKIFWEIWLNFAFKNFFFSCCTTVFSPPFFPLFDRQTTSRRTILLEIAYRILLNCLFV